MLRLFSGVTLIGKHHFQHPTGQLLGVVAQCLHLRPVLFIGGRCGQGQQLTQRIYRQMDLGAPCPSSRHQTRRKSCTAFSKHPDSNHRFAWLRTTSAGGRSCGRKAHCAPVRLIPNSALSTSRSGNFRCGASSGVNARYGSKKWDVSSSTSLGYARRSIRPVCQRQNHPAKLRSRLNLLLANGCT